MPESLTVTPVLVEQSSAADNGDIVGCITDDSATGQKDFYKEEGIFRLRENGCTGTNYRP